jgi:hypothetical protein
MVRRFLRLVFLVCDRVPKDRSKPRVENARSRQFGESAQIHAPRPVAVRDSHTSPVAART